MQLPMIAVQSALTAGRDPARDASVL